MTKTVLEPTTYRVAAAAYLRATATRAFRAWAMLPVAAILISLALAIVLADLRWAILALMLLFVVTPMIAAPILLAKMMQPGLRTRIGELSVTWPADETGSIVIKRIEPDESAGSPTPARIIAIEEIPASEIAAVRKTTRAMAIVTFVPGAKRLPLLIPSEILL